MSVSGETTTSSLQLRDTVDEFRAELLDAVFYLTVLVYTLYLYLTTLEFDESGALVPQVVSYILFALCLIGLVRVTLLIVAESTDVLPDSIGSLVQGKQREEPEEEAEQLLAEEEDEESEPISYLRFGSNLVGIVLFIGMLTTLGFFTATFLFTAGYILATKRNPVRAVVWSGGLTVLLYFIFIELLNFTLILREGMFI